MSNASPSATAESRWALLLGGFAALFALMHGLAGSLASMRGEAGLMVAAATIGAALVLVRMFYARNWRESWITLGLGRPRWLGVQTAATLCLLLLAVYPVYLAAQGSFFSVYPNAGWLALGIFAQAGLAEECVFRGFLYGQLRRRYPFWRAALLSTLPFAAAHLLLFATMAWPIALAALLLSVVLSFPLARLYDLSGGTIWAPALAHAVVQGAIKLLVIEDPAFPLVWMAACAILPWLVFAVSSSADNRS